MQEKVLQEALNTLVLEGNNTTRAAKAMGASRSTFRGWLEKAKLLGMRATVTDPQLDAQIKKVELLKDREIADLKKRLKIAQEDALVADKIREYVFDLKNYSPREPAWLTEDKLGEHQPGVMVVHLSDWHWGEVVRPEEINNLNEFNLDIARIRCQVTFNNILDIAANHTKPNNFAGLVICLGGDMISGHIHPELESTNELPTIPTVFDLFDNLVAGVNRAAAFFNGVTIFCAYGNHGRNTAKPSYKLAHWVNFDWMLYNMLARHYKDNPKVNVILGEGFDQVFKVYGKTFLLTHGDRMGVKGGDGIVGLVGPVIRGAKKIKANYANVHRPIDTILCGHWHHKIATDHIRVNGSLKGYDEYALGNRLDFQVPTQDMFFVHPRHGITYEIPLFSQKTDQTTDQAWVSWVATTK